MPIHFRFHERFFNTLLVPGNNDIEGERASEETLAYWTRFLQDVQKELEGSTAVLHDITACYLGRNAPLSGCYADVPGTAFRLVGFPSYSFKNEKEQTYKDNQEQQKKQMEKFASLIVQSQIKGKKVIVLSHIAPLDDPYTQARERFAGMQPDTYGNLERPRWSSWNVSSELFVRWKEIVDSETVVGVLAGHFHDSHREIYYPPYAWSAVASNRPNPGKLFLAPPLAVKLQDGSPVQARGFALVRLAGDGLTRRLFWINAENSAFTPDPSPARPSQKLGPVEVVLWLGGLAVDLKPLERATVVFIALLMAFLTVAGLWKPGSGPRLTEPVAEVGADSTPPATGGSAKQAETETPLTSNFGKTVLSGLGGMVLVTFLEPFWEKSGITAKAYYLVWFVFLFLVLLIGSALFHGLGEAWRSRIAIEHQAPPWTEPPSGQRRGKQLARYWLRRFWLWVFSFRTTVLVFFDTAVSFLFGKNLSRSAVLGDEIVELQVILVRTVDRLRDEITGAVRRALIEALRAKAKVAPAETVPPGNPASDLDEGAIRVNISVLSNDRSSLFYVSWTPGSLVRSFEKQSVAWVSVCSGEARWWKQSYEAKKDRIVLFDNEKKKLLVPQDKLMLRDYFQARESYDYKAFIVLPVPWRRRGMTARYRMAGIHISFSEEDHLDKLWPTLKEDENDAGSGVWEGYYKEEKVNQILDKTQLKNDELRAVLQQSVEALGELLRGFNQAVFETHIRPRLTT